MSASSEVVIVGAGPAGSVAALLLARNSHRVTLVDRCEFPRDKACGDLIGTFAIDELRRLEIDLRVVAATPPLHGAFVHASDGRRLGAMIPPGVAARLGARVIPRRIFDAALVAAAVDAGAIFRHATATHIMRDDAGHVTGVQLSDGSIIAARLVIGADGWGSIVARDIVKSPRATRDIGIAVRSYVEGLKLDEAMHFYVGVRGDGYGWVFPRADGRANVGLGFIRNEPGADGLDAAFTRFLARPELRGARHTGAPRTWPIPFGWRSTPVTAAGAILVGDAASLASSLSGSGIHTAIASAAIAADVASHALKRDDVSATALRAYDRRLRPIANRLRFERWLHYRIGTPAASRNAIGIASRIPGTGALAVPWLLNLG